MPANDEGMQMLDVLKQGFYVDDERTFPRFLNRDEARDDALGRATSQPPPLPRQMLLKAEIERLWQRCHDVSGFKLRSVAGLGVALAVVVPAAASLIADQGWRQADAPHIKSAVEAHDEIAQALQIVEVFEARLGYAGHLASIQQEQPAAAAPETRDGLQLADATSPPTQSAVVPDSVGLLILRGLPTGVTFTTGAPAGDGAWAMPPGDPDHPVTVLGGGLDTPVTTDVDMISHDGLLLGSFQLELHKPVEVAAAPVAADDGPSQATAPAIETTDAAAKPVKRRRQANAGAQSKIAQADAAHKKRVRRARDPLKAKAPPAPQPEENAGAVAATGSTPDGEEQKPGLISKFVAWLKSGQNTATAKSGEDATGTRMGLSPEP